MVWCSAFRRLLLNWINWPLTTKPLWQKNMWICNSGTVTIRAGWCGVVGRKEFYPPDGCWWGWRPDWQSWWLSSSPLPTAAVMIPVNIQSILYTNWPSVGHCHQFALNLHWLALLPTSPHSVCCYNASLQWDEVIWFTTLDTFLRLD